MTRAGGRAGRAERVAQPGVEALVLTQHDPAQDRSPFAGKSGRDRAREPVMKTVREAREPTTSAHDSPAHAVQDDVHATSAQPGALVEVVDLLSG